MNCKVLVVDDSKLARMVMASAFRRLRPDWELVEATGAAEALETVSSGNVDIALIDFNMPGSDGLHLAADLRKLNPQMPIAIISANHQQEVINRTNALGATFLPKPVAEQALRAFSTAATRELQGAGS